jgi:hypothetical protein
MLFVKDYRANPLHTFPTKTGLIYEKGNTVMLILSLAKKTIRNVQTMFADKICHIRLELGNTFFS